METWMQIAAFNPFLLKAIISLAIDILDVKRLLFSQHELSICLSISLASLKKQLVIVVPRVKKVWIQAGHPY